MKDFEGATSGGKKRGGLRLTDSNMVQSCTFLDTFMVSTKSYVPY